MRIAMSKSKKVKDSAYEKGVDPKDLIGNKVQSDENTIIKGFFMGIYNFIETAMNSVLKNPIVSVLRDINFSSILKQSNFIK